MRAAMAAAEVGDDGFGDDPTVMYLEERVAALMGTQSALFTCGGTMSNLLAVLAVLGTGGGTIVAGERAHLLHHENDGARVLARARVRSVPDPDGELDAAAVAAELPSTPSMVWLENTGNLTGGNAQDEASLRRQAAPARRAGAAVHLDGARLANAAVALGRPIAELAEVADTISFSLCKGLGGPAGSLLCGSAALVREARYLRRMIGGTMHQAGVLAAAGLVALDRLPGLADDHRRAAALRDGLAALPDVEVVTVPRPTNMVLFGIHGMTAEAVLERTAAAGVLGLPITAGTVRLVVHREHSNADIARAVERIAAALPVRSRT